MNVLFQGEYKNLILWQSSTNIWRRRRGLHHAGEVQGVHQDGDLLLVRTDRKPIDQERRRGIMQGKACLI